MFGDVNARVEGVSQSAVVSVAQPMPIKLRYLRFGSLRLTYLFSLFASEGTREGWTSSKLPVDLLRHFRQCSHAMEVPVLR